MNKQCKEGGRGEGGPVFRCDLYHKQAMLGGWEGGGGGPVFRCLYTNVVIKCLESLDWSYQLWMCASYIKRWVRGRELTHWWHWIGHTYSCECVHRPLNGGCVVESWHIDDIGLVIHTAVNVCMIHWTVGGCVVESWHIDDIPRAYYSSMYTVATRTRII